MPVTLSPHPGDMCEAVTRIEADVSRLGGLLRFNYRLFGRTAGLLIPAASASGRADNLWEHTCFEAFVRPVGSSRYWELNFAPSTQWAAYRLDSYRTGMTAPREIKPPIIEAEIGSSGLRLSAEIELDLSGPVDLALSAVVEDATGRKSYWALAHPSGKADFHHADSFALKLPGTTS